jgi:hypothetical protein
MTISRRMPLVGNRVVLRKDDCRILGIDYVRGYHKNEAQSAISFVAGKAILIADARVSRGELLRSLRLIKEEIALDDYFSLEPKSRAIWLESSKLKRKSNHRKIELPA